MKIIVSGVMFSLFARYLYTKHKQGQAAETGEAAMEEPMGSEL